MPKIKESEIPETQTEILGINASANPSFPIVMFCKFKKIVADRIPVTPPKNESIIPSATINHAIDNLVYPKVLRTARETYPREQSLIIEELNIYLTSGDFEKAKTNLQIAAEQDPTNEILWFSLGSVFDNLGNTEEAADAYLKAIEVKEDYFDANYNLGALYFNQAVQGINKANDMWKPRMSSKEAAAQKKLESDAKELFSTAKPYLEKAHEVNPEDLQTIRSLKDIYARTAEDEKFMKMNNLLKAAQQ